MESCEMLKGSWDLWGNLLEFWVDLGRILKGSWGSLLVHMLFRGYLGGILVGTWCVLEDLTGS